ncbi:hypothetical protein BZA05DRAFT_106740 [Tricharina praecox]|uniref:uncharacterized protein n=1 Tax=Tricharina praecox TaxID=43433 RepID=UPI002220EA92|nr:uncharacterized protein BZA05DRAFT_106740 [Tricharina praecox]KAI5857799.1 hypothetical protein BZA05DRAFT_106740 [Tricharina praecox]
MPSFQDLPFELVSEILSIAAKLNANDLNAVTYTYGLTQAPRPMQNKAYIQKYLRGRVPTDVQRWHSVDAIRQVSAQWHEWALSHALRELYIRRWQGGETWMRRAFENALPVEILPVVYQNPYKSVKSTAKLFGDYPQLARHVRKIWFNGIYRFDTVGYVFQILQNCRNVRTVTIPWTALRYGDSADWNNVLSFPRLTSLEFLAVGLKNEVCEFPESHRDTEVLGKTPSLDFSKLRRLKIFGDSNLKPISDEDLFFMARTATNLEEILITNVTSITAKGVSALVSASRETLKLLEFIPLAKDGFEPVQTPEDNRHICNLLASCPRLSDLAITVPSVCPELFSNPGVDWKETVRVRVGSHGIRGEGDNRADNITALLDSARTLLEKKNSDNLDIEIAVGPYLFEAKSRLVHGSYIAPKLASDNQWRPMEVPSVKGPYGYTGLYGGGKKGEWSAIGEADFVEAVRAGLVNLDV